MNASLEDRIIAQTFVTGNFTFAEGIPANNKLVAERLQKDPKLFEEVIHGLGQLATGLEPDTLTYVPNGARIFAEPLAKMLNLPVVHLFKQTDLKGQPGRMFYRRPMDEKLVLHSKIERIVIIEDISRTFGSVSKVLALEGIKEKAVGLVSIFHRGLPGVQKNFKLDAQSLAARYLPPQMTEEQLAEYSAMATELN